MSLRLVPVRFRDACSFVEMWHRHHDAPQGIARTLWEAP